MKNLLIIITCSLLVCFSYAQDKITNPLRYEINIGISNTNETPCSVFNCNENGVVVAYIYTKNDSSFITLVHLDVNLETVEEKIYGLNGTLFVKNYCVDDKFLYIALSTSEDKKKSMDIVFLKYDLLKWQLSSIKTQCDNAVEIRDMLANNSIVYVSTKDKKNRDFLFTVNFVSEKISFLCESLDSKMYHVFSIYKNNENNRVYICLSINDKKEQTFNIIQHDGSIVYNKNFGDSLHIVFAVPIFSSDTIISAIAGAYYNGKYNNNPYSADGIFTVNILSDKINYFPYNVKNKDNYYSWQYNKYILSSELFSPKYKVIPHTDYDFYGRPYTRYYQEFIGYTTINNYNFVFDSIGTLKSISSLPIENTLNTNIPFDKVLTEVIDNQILDAYFALNNITFRFTDENNISSTTIHLYVAKKYATDNVETEYESKIEKWYDDFYFITGYQLIRNSRGQQRRVFYIQKVEL